MKVLGVDYGSKRVGIASGDLSNKIAFPKEVLTNKDADQLLSDLLNLCEDEGYGVVIFGAPFHMNDEESSIYKEVASFVKKFEKASVERGLGLEVELLDERLSSFEADQLMDDFKGKKVRMKEGDRDMLAAKVILERWFEEQE
ncbi:Holliday junction resolvase RuvX [Candidatus Peregrinibacteria bacterium]|jgi:putative holliday junction resolvase|nr:Holliday junction resolvase RuvX [Candidatus Peregrinibacteria bacterium]MBT4148343.1 Holliday junction resolvase RuvX [Candidatus Peregrinibacteria bacterium]MBT4366690.1 Holliday junction resolvase RuvX [Candidatus Peregrinibacteria bacterium]MBT4455904.1 Holliday junction resolvase RuvX [Candidatus Peregrinibacteria bacterium]